ncbi:unnamed protein product [Ixodes hexagonus]
MMSPSYFSGSTYASIAGQARPPPNICDYIILDIRMNRTHGYNRLDYDFLKSMKNTSKFLFTIMQESSPDALTGLSTMTDVVKEKNFVDVAQELQNFLPVHGFGFLHFNYSNSGRYLGTLRSSVVTFYKELRGSLIQAGYQNITNFITMQVFATTSQREVASFNQELNGHAHFIVAETFAASKRPACRVEAVSSYEGDCYAGDFNPTLMNSSPTRLFLLLTTPCPLSASCLLLPSCSRELFQRSGCPVRSSYTQLDRSGSMIFSETYWGCRLCSTSLIWHDPYSIPVSLVPHPPRCLERERANVSNILFQITDIFQLQQQQTFSHNITWLVYNLTKNLGHVLCGGEHRRLLTIRTVFDNLPWP